MTMLKEEMKCSRFGFSDCNSQVFYTAQFPMPWKYLFLSYRLFVLIYMTAWLIPHSIHPDVQGTFHWYLTNWAEVILIFYFLIAFLSLLLHLLTGNTNKIDVNKCTDHLSWYHKVHWITFNIAADITIVVVVLFWTLAAKELPASSLRHPIVIQLHGINLLLLLVDIFIISIPVRILHLIYGLATAIVYIFFSLILHWSGVKSDIYEGVIDWEDTPVSSILFSLLGGVVVIISHVITFLLYKLRIFLFNKYFPPQQDSSPHFTPQPTDQSETPKPSALFVTSL